MLELQRWLYAEAGVQLKSFANGIDPLTLLTGISIAALFGLVHAFMPGHGKTVLVSYFLGRPSKVVAGLGASIILVLTHVGSAVVLVLTGFIVIRGTIGARAAHPNLKPPAPPLSSLLEFGCSTMPSGIGTTIAPQQMDASLHSRQALFPVP